MKLTSYPGLLFFLISDGGEGVSFIYLKLVPYQSGEMPWGRDFHQPHELFTKQAPHKKLCLPFILRISFVNLNQPAEDSCRFVPINKIHF